MHGDPGPLRTGDFHLRRVALYPAELRGLPVKDSRPTLQSPKAQARCLLWLWMFECRLSTQSGPPVLRVPQLAAGGPGLEYRRPRVAARLISRRCVALAGWTNARGSLRHASQAAERRMRTLLVRQGVLSLCLLAWAASFNSASAGPANTVARPGALSVEQAQDRARRLSGIAYRLSIDLKSQREDFGGSVVTTFDLADTDRPLALDFEDGAVQSVVANGRRLEGTYDGHSVVLPASALQPGRNTVEIAFRHRFLSNGTGLHRFVDPLDGRTYLYTYLWPYYANRVFPLFDQPDLKAVYELDVRAPDGWEVISAGAGRVVSRGAGVAHWRFLPTARIASYAFSLHAGPYRKWESAGKGIPMRLFARHSMADKVDAKAWFAVTERGLDYFGSYFGVAYPFGKYDQLLVPDFNIGAMENVSAVTFTEGLVQSGGGSAAEQRVRENTILHEMAHMWFGNLATHRWWNGLWLNESFATQMAQLAQEDVVGADGIAEMRLQVFAESKLLGYQKDGRVTTHPVESPVPGTDAFFSVFDNITYHKGAAALDQLRFRVGPEAYRRGVSAYLKQHAYANTELSDFVDAIGAAAGEDLGSWSQQWLYTTGFNVVQATPECRGDRLERIRVMQSPGKSGSAARSHVSRLALYGIKDGRLETYAEMDLRLDSRETIIPVAAGLACPVLAYPNQGDHGYFQVGLTTEEMRLLVDHVARMEDPFAQAMLLQSLREAAAQGRLAQQDFARAALGVMEQTKSATTRAYAGQTLRAAITLLERLSPESDELLITVRPEIERSAVRGMAGASAEDARIWFDLFVAVGATDDALARTRELLDGPGALANGLTVSDDRRWELLSMLARRGDGSTATRLAAERVRDPGATGRARGWAVQAALPSLSSKRELLAAALTPGHVAGASGQRAIIGALLPANQGKLAEALLPDVLRGLETFGPGSDDYAAAAYARSVLVPLCSEQGRDMYAKASRGQDALGSTARTFLREAVEEEANCGQFRAGWPKQ